MSTALTETTTTTTTRLSILKTHKLANQENEVAAAAATTEDQSEKQLDLNHHHHHHHHHNHHHHHHRNSILTRNLRLTSSQNNNNNGNGSIMHSPQKFSLISNLNHSYQSSSSAANLQQQQQQQQQQSSYFTNKTLGFADLSFVDFSCVNFPRIAQNYCELYPRKVAANSPLHNYTCPRCQHSFPCPVSLSLHMQNDLNCKLLLSSLTKTVYKTLDDLIKQIEYENELHDCGGKAKQRRDSEDKKAKFLKSLGLIRRSDDSTRSDSELKKKRAKLLDINQQFIKDLDNWKLSHVNSNLQLHTHLTTIIQPNQTQTTAQQKILLKPNVNVNRPLLIRSKKVKRIRSFGQASSFFHFANKATKEATANSIKSLVKEEIATATSNDENKNNSVVRIVRIARSNSTSSSSTVAPTPTSNDTADPDHRPALQQQPRKRKILSVNDKRFKKMPVHLGTAPTTVVDSISFKKILTISNELTSNLSKTLNKTSPPPLYKVPPALSDHKQSLLSNVNLPLQNNSNKKSLEMPKLQPIPGSNKNSTQQGPPKLLKPHIKSAAANKKIEYGENVVLKCKVCPGVFKGKTLFISHMVEAHNDVLRERFKSSNNNNNTSPPSNNKNSNLKVKVN